MCENHLCKLLQSPNSGITKEYLSIYYIERNWWRSWWTLSRRFWLHFWISNINRISIKTV